MADVNATDEVLAGARVLSLFANPLNAKVLRAHAEGPQRLAGLHEDLGHTAYTTLRAAVANLCEIGALARSEVQRGPFSAPTELTPAGEEMLFVGDVLEAWLAGAPEGPISPDSDAARSAVKALAGGWSSRVMRFLAGQSYSLTELDRLIPQVSYPSLERRLARMRVNSQIKPTPGKGASTPYAVTDWLRRSIAPLCAAGRCERRWLEGAAPITSVEVEAAFLLTIPLVPLPGGARGTCMLAVQTEPGEPEHGIRDLSGVVVEVERGQAVSCAARVSERPPTWALGGAETWLDAVIDGRLETLRPGGANPQLALDLANGLHYALFRDPAP